MNNEEKKKIVDEACDIFNEAINLVAKAKKMLLDLNIDFCNGIYEERYSSESDNLQVYKGIDELEKITEAKAQMKKRKTIYSKYLEYKGILFMQVANTVNGEFIFK